MDKHNSNHSPQFKNVDVETIDYDASNPRLALALQLYGDDIDAKKIAFALKEGGEAGFQALRDAIEVTGRIINPIIINTNSSGQLIVVEGNTRLAIYKDFNKQKEGDSWKYIPAAVYDGLPEKEVDSIRLQAHLVGAREWEPFAKAKYLHYLSTHGSMRHDELVAFCGGKKRIVVEMIQAYEDIIEFYPKDDNGNIVIGKKFTCFQELQRSQVKQILMAKDISVEKFSEWVKEGKFSRNEDVRSLPSILKDKIAYNTFLVDGSKAAKLKLETPDEVGDLKDKSLVVLSKALRMKLSKITAEEIDHIRESSDAATELSMMQLELETWISNYIDEE